MKTTPHDNTEKRLVFVGGGHAHALALRMLAMNPIAHTDLCLISSVTHTPYSGMLPGYIAGYYSYDDIHIDLRTLSTFSGARFIRDEVAGIDRVQRLVLLKNHPPVTYDILSINIGITPRIPEQLAKVSNIIPIKPVAPFIEAWDRIVEAQSHSTTPLRIIVVGGGAGGLEVAINMRLRLRDRVQITLLDRNPVLLFQHSSKVQSFAYESARRFNIEVLTSDEPFEVHNHAMKTRNGKVIAFDKIMVTTEASAPAWLRDSGLATDQNGFLQVGETLQVTNDHLIFGAGDIAHIAGHPRPKTGVYAVRAAPYLAQNIRRLALGQDLVRYRPQRYALNLIGVPGLGAIASRGDFAYRAKWLWPLKKWIDRRFMEKFSDLPSIPMAEPSAIEKNLTFEEAAPICKGCAAKLGPQSLSIALTRISANPALHAALAIQEDDAAYIKMPPSQALMQSVDFLTPIVDDLYQFGQIASEHAFNDVFSKGAQAHSALVHAALRHLAPRLHEEDLYQLLTGVATALARMKAQIIGGHTSVGREPGLGITVNGVLLEGRKPVPKNGLLIGDALILTKPLGTGILFAGEMQLKSRGRWLDQAIQSMLLSHAPLAPILHQFPVSAATDISGFGCIGHMLEMLKGPNQVTIHVDISSVPIFKGAAELYARGITSSAHTQNHVLADRVQFKKSYDPLFNIFFDPQTSGPILLALPAAHAKVILERLHAIGLKDATQIGRVEPKTSHLSPWITFG